MKLSAKRSGRLLKIYLVPQWPQLALLCVLLFGGITLSLVNPQLLSSFIDAISARMPLPALLRIAALYLVVAVFKQIVAMLETYVAENISLRSINRLRTDLTLHCLQLDLPFHTTHTPGELIERIDGDVAALGNFFSRFLLSLVGNALLVLGMLVILLRIDWRIGVALSICTALSLAIVGSLRNLATPHWEAERQASAELFGFLEERLSATEDIRSSGATTYIIHGLARHSRSLLLKFRRAIQANYVTWSGLTFLTAIGTAVGLALGVYLFSRQEISIGTVYLIFAYTTLLNAPIEEIVHQLRDLQQTTGSLTRILALLDTNSTIKDGVDGKLPDGALSVQFEDVSFHYTEESPVLQHITLTLQPGEVLGLLGRTGSGKSTLTKLLVRLYDPTSGTIRLGGVDLRTLQLDDVRTRIGIVPQDVRVLHATVRDNLTLFDTSIADERIVQALEELGLGSWYHSLPHGLDSILEANNSGLSAGEAQLLSFARVFLRDPSLLILDEASSRLDPATERLLQQAIQRLLTGRTGIIIAHRLATLQQVDTLMVLENGQCCEYGAREKLACDSSSRYAQWLHVGLEEALK